MLRSAPFMTLESTPAYGKTATLSDAANRDWRWFVGLGALSIVVGMAAFWNVLIATLAAVFYVGALMIVGAAAHIISAFRAHKWNSSLAWLCAGILYGLAGAVVFYNPLAAASALTLVVAFMMMLAGALRIVVGFRERPQRGWEWIMASGAMTILVGVVIAFSWPSGALWVLGLMLGIDLLFQGSALIAVGFELRKRHRSRRIIES